MKGSAGSVHAVAWAVWALGATVAVQLTPGPLYVLVVLVITALVVETHADRGALARAFPLIVAVGFVFALLRVVLTGLTTHHGGDVLVRLPAFTLPRLLGGFAVGGDIETEVVLRSAADGLVIVGIIAVFGAFNAVVSHYELVRVAPRAFYEIGLVVTVALAFVPSLLNAIADVREADRARTAGATRERGVRRRRLVRTIVPVLESGMERAMELAASMDARGFGRDAGRLRDTPATGLSLAGLGVLAGAFGALVVRERAVALVLAAAGTVLLATAVALVSRHAPRPRHRRRRLSASDGAVIAAAVASPVGLGLLRGAGRVQDWEPGAGLPGFELAGALCLLLLALPAGLPGARTRAPDGAASVV